MKNKCIKIYFQDIRETLIVYFIMMFIISCLLVIMRFPFYFHFVNLFFVFFYLFYFKNELKMYYMVYDDLKCKRKSKKIVTFDKIESDLKYGRPKRKEVFKKYQSPRYSFYFEKQLYRIGFNVDNLLYNSLRGKEFEIEYLENSRLIINLKPLFNISENDKNRYIKSFGECKF